MTELQGMVLGFMRTLNQWKLIDDPYMQQLVVAMQGTESRGALKVPVRRVVEALQALEVSGIIVDGVRRELRWSSCNDEKMHCLLLCRAKTYCFKCKACYNNADDCKQPKGFHQELSITDYEEHSASFLLAAEAWVKKQNAAGIKAATVDFKSTVGSASERDHNAWYEDHKGFTGEMIMPPGMPLLRMWVDVSLHLHLNMVSGKLVPIFYTLIKHLEDQGTPARRCVSGAKCRDDGGRGRRLITQLPLQARTTAAPRLARTAPRRTAPRRTAPRRV
jgi:hypothetical protein